MRWLCIAQAAWRSKSQTVNSDQASQPSLDGWPWRHDGQQLSMHRSTHRRKPRSYQQQPQSANGCSYRCWRYTQRYSVSQTNEGSRWRLKAGETETLSCSCVLRVLALIAARLRRG